MINILLDAQTLAAEKGYDFFAFAAIVLGGTGFWKLLELIFQAKREDKKEKNTNEDKVDGLVKQVSDLSLDFSDISHDIKDIKRDLALLQEANNATVAYRELRDKQDQENLKAQDAVIEALKGMIRDRLLETYERCMAKGYYTIEERDIYSKLYACYRDDPFSGNGTIAQLHDEIILLPKTADAAKK